MAERIGRSIGLVLGTAINSIPGSEWVWLKRKFRDTANDFLSIDDARTMRRLGKIKALIAIAGLGAIPFGHIEIFGLAVVGCAAIGACENAIVARAMARERGKV